MDALLSVLMMLSQPLPLSCESWSKSLNLSQSLFPQMVLMRPIAKGYCQFWVIRSMESSVVEPCTLESDLSKSALYYWWSPGQEAESLWASHWSRLVSSHYLWMEPVSMDWDPWQFPRWWAASRLRCRRVDHAKYSFCISSGGSLLSC